MVFEIAIPESQEFFFTVATHSALRRHILELASTHCKVDRSAFIFCQGHLLFYH